MFPSIVAMETTPAAAHSAELITSLDIADSNDTNYTMYYGNVNGTGNMVQVLTSYDLYLTRLVVQRFLVPVVVFCGIVGNSFNVIVLRNPQMRTSTNVYLMALALCDSLYLLFSLSLSFLHCSNKNQSALGFYYIPYARVLSDLFGNTAVWLTVCFTLERYIGVCLPMKGKAWCTVGKAKCVVLVSFIVCLLNTIPELFEMKIIRTHSPMSDWLYECKYTEFAESDSYQIGYYWWFVTLFTFLPLLILSIFNSLLIRSVWQASKNRKILSNSRVLGDSQRQPNEQQKVTTMLIAVVLIFIFCQLPQAVLLVYKSYMKANNLPYPVNLLKIAGNICNLLVQINASVNFFLYSYFSSKFRRTFKKVICTCKKPWSGHPLVSWSGTFRRKSSSTTGTTLTSSSSTSCRTRKSLIDGSGGIQREDEQKITKLG